MDYGALIVWFFLALVLLIYAPLVLVAALMKRDKDNVYKKGLGVLVLVFLFWSAHVYKTFFLDEALISASYKGDVERVRTLLRRGANPQASFEGTTSLHAAKTNSHHEVIKILIEAGAKE